MWLYVIPLVVAEEYARRRIAQADPAACGRHAEHQDARCRFERSRPAGRHGDGRFSSTYRYMRELWLALKARRRA